MDSQTAIGIVMCGKHKHFGWYRAKDIYTSKRFRNAFTTLSQITPHVYILSAKHGLLPAYQRIFTYNKNLLNFTPQQLEKWAISVVADIRKLQPTVTTVWYSGDVSYLEAIKPHFPKSVIIKQL